MSEKINYFGNEQILIEATAKANLVLKSEYLHQSLVAKATFDHSNASGAVISQLIKSTKIVAKVELYKAAWRWSRANGYTLPDGKNIIFINARKLNGQLDANDVAATLVHEFIHLLDFENEAYYFHHDDNDDDGKDHTAPYWIDNIAAQILSQIS